MSANAKSGFGVVLLVAALVGGLWLFFSGDADALPPYTRLTDFYSDATFTTFTGACWRGCTGSSSCESGTQQTEYSVVERDYECNGQGFCCIICRADGVVVTCPQHILNNYPCPEGCPGV